MNKFKQKVYQFMQGRYGMDTLGNFLLWTGMILLILNIFIGNVVLELLVWAMIIYTYFRILSRNYAKRNAENTWFLEHTQGLREKWHRFVAHARIRKTHHIYTCPGCGQKIKVPKGKGRIAITCPKCRIEFTKKS
jgi:predicted SprT family Zn-dependent metalloprotease